MARIALFGLPATGKGTLATALSKEFGYVALSTGDMIRRMRKVPGPVGDELRALPAWGFANDDLIVRAVAEELKHPKYDKGVIFDGFPRTLAQLKAIDQEGLKIDAAIVLEAPEEALIARAVNRRVHVASGRVYNMLSAPRPKIDGFDDVTGEPLTRRDDDCEEVIRKRFVDYWEKTNPLVEALRLRGVVGVTPFLSIDAFVTPERVMDQVREGLETCGVVDSASRKSRKPSMG